MDSRKSALSSGAKLRRYNIPTAVNTTDNGHAEFEMGSSQRGFQRHQGSKSKLVKTAIVKPFRLEADLETANFSGDSFRNPVANPSEHTPRTITPDSNVQGASRSKEKNTASVITERYKPHSGIPFVQSPRKCTLPNPFKLGRESNIRTDAQSKDCSSTAAPVVRQSALHRKLPSSRVKPKLQLKEAASQKEQPNHLSVLTKTVLSDFPGKIQKFSGHSGMVLKTRKWKSTQSNPFATNEKAALPGDHAEK